LQRLLIGRFLDAVTELTQPLQFTSVLDAGSGEGFVSQRILEMRPDVTFVGVDLDREALLRGQQVHPEIAFARGDVYVLPFADNSVDLVLCNEVLEHLTRPDRVLDELRRVSRRYCLLSVPHEPYFRLMNLLRGKNVSRLGNDEDHRQLWGAKGFRRLAHDYFRPLGGRYPLPWQLFLGDVV
jgi:SAM-dependent methyltransferase